MRTDRQFSESQSVRYRSVNFYLCFADENFNISGVVTVFLFSLRSLHLFILFFYFFFYPYCILTRMRHALRYIYALFVVPVREKSKTGVSQASVPLRIFCNVCEIILVSREVRIIGMYNNLPYHKVSLGIVTLGKDL